jgi:membrane protease YdiL (CAAX protease family)
MVRMLRFFVVDGQVRPIWRAALYFGLGTWVLMPLTDWLHPTLVSALRPGQGFSAGAVALGEAELFVVALICTAILGAYERRRADRYGLPLESAFRSQTLEGAACGVAMAGAVALGMLALGGMTIHGFATTGSAVVLSGLAWLGANICIGVAEEFWFRSYLLQTLWRSLGFWPGAIVTALIFTAAHYFYKQGENIWDVITLISLSLLMSYTVLRTGTLWFAVGFHVAFDYMQLFIIGTPNGSRLPAGRLLDVTFQGPAWLTGGNLGTEASFLMYPMIALLWVYVARRFRDRPPLRMA